jgi:hypothetical protein
MIYMANINYIVHPFIFAERVACLSSTRIVTQPLHETKNLSERAYD